MNPSSTLPLLPCKALDKTLIFYRALGFAVTHEQEAPYLYAAVQRGEVRLHFANLAVYGARDAFGASLVFVDDARARHREFADGLRDVYGAVPTVGCPRISRMPPPLFRFQLFVYKSMTSLRDHRIWQDVYHLPFESRVLYVKFTTDETGYLLISLKDK